MTAPPVEIVSHRRARRARRLASHRRARRAVLSAYLRRRKIDRALPEVTSDAERAALLDERTAAGARMREALRAGALPTALAEYARRKASR